MKIENIGNMVKGWFVGDFVPAVVCTKDVEVAVKFYKAGDFDAWHYHKVATEITVIVTGEAEMNGRRLTAGDIVLLKPGEESEFVAITDTINVVVKLPSVQNDKYGRSQ